MKTLSLRALALLLILALLPLGGLGEEDGGETIAPEETSEAGPEEAEGESLAELAEAETPAPTAEPTPAPTEKPDKIPWLTSYNYPESKVSFEKEIWSVMTRKWGLSDFQAAGLMSSIQAESGFSPYNAQGTDSSDDRGKYEFKADDSVGFGLCQWTTPGRKSALLSHAKAHGSEELVWDFDIQMGFMGKELDINSLKTAKSLYDVAEWAVLRYERPNLSKANAWPGTRYEKGKAIYKRHTGRDYEEPALHFSVARADGEAVTPEGVGWSGGPLTLTVRSNYYWRLEQLDATADGWLRVRCPSPYDPDTMEDCVCGYASDGDKPLTLTAARVPPPGESYTAVLSFDLYRGGHEVARFPVTFTTPPLPPLWFRAVEAAGVAAAVARMLGK